MICAGFQISMRVDNLMIELERPYQWRTCHMMVDGANEFASHNNQIGEEREEKAHPTLVECFAIFVRWRASSIRIRFAYSNGNPLYCSPRTTPAEKCANNVGVFLRGDSFLSSILFDDHSCAGHLFTEESQTLSTSLTEERWMTTGNQHSSESIDDSCHWRHTRHESERKRSITNNDLSLFLYSQPYFVRCACVIRCNI